MWYYKVFEELFFLQFHGGHGEQHRDGGQPILGEYAEDFWLLEVSSRHFGTNWLLFGPKLPPLTPIHLIHPDLPPLALNGPDRP